MNYTLNDIRAGVAMLSRYQDKREVFHGFLDFILLEFQEVACSAEDISACVKRFHHPDALTILFDLMQATYSLSKGYRDPLGQIFSEEISYGKMGQFFTPSEVCEVLNGFIIDSHAQPGTQLIIDPTCGSGRTILAAAKKNKDQLFFGADIDIICCKMTLVNFMFNNIIGEIAHLNTLTNEFFSVFITLMRSEGDWMHPYYIKSTNPHKSVIHLKRK